MKCSVRARMAASLAVAALWCTEPQCAADSSGKKAGSALEIELSAWALTQGLTSLQHNAMFFGQAGPPVSKLSYADTQTLVGFSATAWPAHRWFLRTEFATSLASGSGTLTDDDFVLGSQPLRRYSRTDSDLDTSVQYLRISFGRRVLRISDTATVDLFGGLQFWRTQHQAFGLRQIDCDRDSPAVVCLPVSSVARLPGRLVILDVTRQVSLRVGASAYHVLLGPIGLEGQLALSPLAVAIDDDVHRFRRDYAQHPSSRATIFTVGGELDAGLRVKLAEYFVVRLGYRIWANSQIAASTTFYLSDGKTVEQPVSEFFSLRHGATLGIGLAL